MMEFIEEAIKGCLLHKWVLSRWSGSVDRMDCGARLRWNPRLFKGSKGEQRQNVSNAGREIIGQWLGLARIEVV
jgi:hypothetical protein